MTMRSFKSNSVWAGQGGTWGAGRFGSWFAHLLRQPEFAGRALVVAGVALVLVPIGVILAALTLIVAVVAGAMLACQHAMRHLRQRGWLPRGDGRRNVRIVARQES